MTETKARPLPHGQELDHEIALRITQQLIAVDATSPAIAKKQLDELIGSTWTMKLIGRTDALRGLRTGQSARSWDPDKLGNVRDVREAADAFTEVAQLSPFIDQITKIIEAKLTSVRLVVLIEATDLTQLGEAGRETMRCLKEQQQELSARIKQQLADLTREVGALGRAMRTHIDQKAQHREAEHQRELRRLAEVEQALLAQCEIALAETAQPLIARAAELISALS